MMMMMMMVVMTVCKVQENKIVSVYRCCLQTVVQQAGFS